MREVVWVASWDVLFFATPCLAILVWSFSRLDRLISAIRDEENAAVTEFQRPAWDVEPPAFRAEISSGYPGISHP
jgi:hypothetical protein